MQKYNIIRIILVAAIALQVVSCRKSPEHRQPATPGEQVLLMSLATRSGGDADLVLQGEDSYSSLAVYIFSAKTGDMEYAELITDFSPESTASSYSKKIHVTQDNKVVYAIANYAGNSFTAGGEPVTLSKSTTQQTLDALEVSSLAFAGDNIVMIGKEEVEMTSTAVSASISMERLVGRVDVYMFKGQDVENEVMELVSIRFLNQVVKSNALFEDQTMPSGTIRRDELHTLPTPKELSVVPGNSVFAGYKPTQADKSFYSYQNLSGATDPDTDTPALLVTVKVNGTPVEYKGHIVNPAGIHDLERNKIYRVKGVIGAASDMLLLRIDMYDWDVESSDITFGDPEFTFTGENGAAFSGNVSMAAPANYKFTLDGPLGAVWNAGLSNGLEFGFPTENGNVSSGIARDDAYTISITPRMNYNKNIERETWFYINVEGEKAVINPAGAGGAFPEGRRFPGNDTQILIKQTE